jgi:predicted nucleic acid-binding protein
LIDENQIVINDLILAELLPALHLCRQRKLINLLKEIVRSPIHVNWDDIVQMQIICLRNDINKIGLPDLIIAQYAMQNELVLFSHNKHFAKISRHLPLALY